MQAMTGCCTQRGMKVAVAVAMGVALRSDLKVLGMDFTGYGYQLDGTAE